MKTEKTRSIKSTIYKLAIVFLLSFFFACEDLTDSLSPRDNIEDTWKCTETDAAKISKTFPIEIIANANDLDGIKIYNFNQLGDNVYVDAKVTGSSISIPKQDAGGFEIAGSGTIKSGYQEISLSYSVDDGGGKENFTATCKKF